MARRKSVKYETKRKAKIVVFILTLIVIICGRFTDRFDETPVTSPVNYYISDEEVRVHIIDVGQGSSALIQCGKDGILIDGGEREYGKDLITYINRAGVTKLKYVVASHPHTDHIGGLLNVLDVYEVENIIMPKLSSINTPTNKTYEKFLLKIKEKGIKAIAAKFGEKYYINNTVLETFAPLEQDKDLNNMSVVCRISAFGTSFLFPGDASISELNDFYKRGTDFSCDVIAAAHHGSNESLHKNFLTRCNPDIVVYSCGEDNSYGHPHEEVVDFFDDLGTKSYRTDIVGSLLFTCDEDGYTVKEKGRTR